MPRLKLVHRTDRGGPHWTLEHEDGRFYGRFNADDKKLLDEIKHQIAANKLAGRGEFYDPDARMDMNGKN